MVRALAVAVVFYLALAAGAAGSGLGGGGLVEPGPPPSGAKGLGILDLAKAPGGRLVAAVGGLGKPSWFGALRLSPQGKPDQGFGQGGYTAPLKLQGRGPHLVVQANSVLALSRGRVLVGGYQQNSRGGAAPLVAVYGPDGRLDGSFGQGGLVAPKPATEGVDEAHFGEGGGVLLDVATSSGRVIGAGAQNDLAGGRPAAMVIAYTAEGKLDKAFGEGGRYLVPGAPRQDGYTGFTAVDALPSGKLLVAGYLSGRLSVLRLTAAGAPDSSFGGGDGLVTVAPNGALRNCCAAAGRLLVSGGHILVAGRTARGAERPLLLARLDPDGALDKSFGSGGRVIGVPRRNDTTFFIPRALAVQGKRILVAGSHEISPFVPGGPVEVMTVVGFRPDGKVDGGFADKGVQTIAPGRVGVAIGATQLAGGRALFGGAIEAGGFEPVLKRYG